MLNVGTNVLEVVLTISEKEGATPSAFRGLGPGNPSRGRRRRPGRSSRGPCAAGSPQNASIIFCFQQFSNISNISNIQRQFSNIFLASNAAIRC